MQGYAHYKYNILDLELSELHNHAPSIVIEHLMLKTMEDKYFDLGILLKKTKMC